MALLHFDKMNIVIKTGFQNISHNILFQPETVPKGKLLFEAKHILNVEEHRENGVSYLIKAKVIRQTSVTSPPYDTKLHVSFNISLLINVLLVVY